MAGEAPAARRTLAVMSMETRLVMHWTRGERDRTADRKSQVRRPHFSDPSEAGVGADISGFSMSRRTAASERVSLSLLFFC